MNLNWKKILILISFIVAVIIMGYLLYLLFLKPAIPTQPPTGVGINTDGSGLPSSGTNVNIPTLININGTLVPVSNINVNLGPSDLPSDTITASAVAAGGLTETTSLTTNRAYGLTSSTDGNNAIYYDKTTGIFYKITPDGRTSPLSDKVFYQVDNIVWSAQKDKAVLEYPDGSNIVYNFTTGEQVTLPSHWKDFDFSPNGEKIIFKSIGTSSDNSWLAITNADGTKSTKIEHLGDKDSTVYSDWSPGNQIIAMYTEGKSAFQQYLYFVGQNNENFKATMIEGRGFQGQWSENGDRLLYSVYSSATDLKPGIWIVDAQGNDIGKNRRELGLQTWAEKCSFSGNDSIYCAVPQTLVSGAGVLPNDLDNSPCDIYKVDLKTGFKTKIAIPEGNHNVENIVISQDGRYLYFVSKTDGRLYKINLK